MIPEIMTGAVLTGALAASARWTWWRSGAPGLPVLAYRKIGVPPGPSALTDEWVSPEKFREQAAWLASHGHAAVNFSDLVSALNGGKPLPDGAVLITFDGAYEDTYARAFPVLREFGLKANIFTVYNFIGKSDLYKEPQSEPWLRLATLDMLKEMRDSGLAEFGSLTMNHPRLDLLPPEDAAWEMTESKKQLEAALELKVQAFSYPWGRGADSPGIRSFVREAGYALDFGPRRGKAKWPRESGDGPLERIPVGRSDGLLDLKLNLLKGASRLI